MAVQTGIATTEWPLYHEGRGRAIKDTFGTGVGHVYACHSGFPGLLTSRLGYRKPSVVERNTGASAQRERSHVSIGTGLPRSALAESLYPATGAHPLNCNTDAMVVTSAQPEFPELLRRTGHPLEWVVDVTVKLDAKGQVQHTAVSRSYGEATQNHTVVRLALNTEALKAANAARYTPKVVHCGAVPSTYIYQITFTGGP